MEIEMRNSQLARVVQAQKPLGLENKWQGILMFKHHHPEQKQSSRTSDVIPGGLVELPKWDILHID